MRFRTYAGAQPGMSRIVEALAAPGGNTYGATMKDMAYVDSAQAAAGKYASETALNQQQHGARSRITDSLRGVQLPQGLTPELAGDLFVGSSNPNFRDYTQGMRDMGGTGPQMEAMDAARAGDVDRMNRITSVLAETPYEPYSMNETGILNQATGAASYSPGHSALAEQRRAGATENYADARAADALTRQRGFLDVSPGASLYDITGQPPAQPGGAIAAALPGVGPAGVATPGAGPQPVGIAQPGSGIGPLGRAEASEASVMGAMQGAPRLVATAPTTPSQRGAGGSGRDPNALNAQLDEFFLEPALDSRGQPLVDPLSGRQAMNLNMDRREAFLRYYAQNRGRFSDINEALVDYVANVEGQQANPLIDEARDAIARGAPRDKVIERLRSMGIDPRGL